MNALLGARRPRLVVARSARYREVVVSWDDCCLLLALLGVTASHRNVPVTLRVFRSRCAQVNSLCNKYTNIINSSKGNTELVRQYVPELCGTVRFRTEVKLSERLAAIRACRGRCQTNATAVADPITSAAAVADVKHMQ